MEKKLNTEESALHAEPALLVSKNISVVQTLISDASDYEFCDLENLLSYFYSYMLFDRNTTVDELKANADSVSADLLNVAVMWEGRPVSAPIRQEDLPGGAFKRMINEITWLFQPMANRLVNVCFHGWMGAHSVCAGIQKATTRKGRLMIRRLNFSPATLTWIVC